MAVGISLVGQRNRKKTIKNLFRRIYLFRPHEIPRRRRVENERINVRVIIVKRRQVVFEYESTTLRFKSEFRL